MPAWPRAGPLLGPAESVAGQAAAPRRTCHWQRARARGRIEGRRGPGPGQALAASESEIARLKSEPQRDRLALTA